jgi:hypothetical protein
MDLYLLCMESSVRRPVIRHSGNSCKLTALTATGLRTVDLSNLARIRLLTMPGRFGGASA